MSATQRRGKFCFSTGGQTRLVTAATLPLHYESVLDSGDFDTPVDYTPVRFLPADNDPRIEDGWGIRSGNIEYGLGIPAAGVFAGLDGVVGVGARKGSNRFVYRLTRFGHVHWPTRTFIDVGGAPTYNRSNLSQTQTTRNFDGESFTFANTVDWTDIWTTPGGGTVNMRLQFSDIAEKELVIADQVANEWVQANRWLPFVQATVPAATLNDTYFGCIFRIDWSDIPRVLVNSVLQDVDTDFEATDNSVDLEDSLQRSLGFLPIDVLRVPGTRPATRVQLRRRFWLDGDGNHYMLIGLSLADLEALPAGDWVYDPSVTQSSTQLGYQEGAATWTDASCFIWENDPADQPAARYDISGESVPNGSTVSACTIDLDVTDNGGTVSSEFGFESTVTTAAWSGSNLPQDATLIGTAETWTMDSAGTGVEESDDTGDAAAALEDLFELGGWPGNEIVNCAISVQNTTEGQFREFDATASASTLRFTYTAPAAGLPFIKKRQNTLLRM